MSWDTITFLLLLNAADDKDSRPVFPVAWNWWDGVGFLLILGILLMVDYRKFSGDARRQPGTVSGTGILGKAGVNPIGRDVRY